MAEAGKSTTPTEDKKVKGILKHNHEHNPHPEVKFDEMNILETYHPANKDYGHMKIDEPPTPYNREFEDEEVDDGGNKSLCADTLAEKLQNAESRKDSKMESEEEDDEDDDGDLSEAQKEKNNKFQSKRKNHYNEFTNVQKARELIAKELADLEDE